MAIRDSLGDRMKVYERASATSLPGRLPVIIRIDGKAFHTFTQAMERPFDHEFVGAMTALAEFLCDEIATTQLAYVQSDEISLLLHNYKHLNTEPYFNNQVQKMASVSAGLASGFFSLRYDRLATFDARAFVLPESEVANYFLWRQRDAERNSLQALAQSLYSPKQLHSKTRQEQLDLCQAKGRDWNALPAHLKRGRVVRKIRCGCWLTDLEIPIFSKDRAYIERYLETEDASATAARE
jgi:tRNA(His) 5'-end guanylyltransferase